MVILLLVLPFKFLHLKVVLSHDLKEGQQTEKQIGKNYAANTPTSTETGENTTLEIKGANNLDNRVYDKGMLKEGNDKQLDKMVKEWYKILQHCSLKTLVPDNCIAFLHATTVYCALCQYDNDNFNTSVCFLQYPVNVTDTLLRIDRKNTKSLKLVLNNTWTGNIQFESVMDLTMMKDMIQLVRFQVIVCYVEYSTKYHVAYTNETFQKLTGMVKLRINIPMYYSKLTEMVSNFPKLEILDLSYVKLIGMEEMAKIVQKVKETVKELNLNNFQIIGGTGYHDTLCFSMFFGNGSTFFKLHDLTIRDNSLTRIIPGISTFAPHLKILDISHNIIIDSSNAGFLLEVFLHPSLKCFYAADQGVIGGGPDVFQHVRQPDSECIEDLDVSILRQQDISSKTGTQISGMNKNMDYEWPSSRHLQTRASTRAENSRAKGHLQSKSKTDRDSGEIESTSLQVTNSSPRVPVQNHTYIFFDHLAYVQFIGCANGVCNILGQSNVSLLFSGSLFKNESAYLFDLMKCMLPNQFKYGFPVKVIPPLKNIYSFECMLCLQVPIRRSLLKVDLSNQHWEKTIALGLNLHGELCFLENNLQSFRFLDNSAWLKSFKLENDFRHLDSFNDLKNMKYLDLSNNDLTVNVRQEWMSLPNLKNLSLSGNNIFLPSSIEFCASQPILTSMAFYRCNLGQKGSLPVYMVRGCSHLELLHLGKNNLNNSNLETLHFDGVHSLGILNLTENLLTGLTDKFIANLNYLQSIKYNASKNLTIDLSYNNILCNCGYYKFAMWLVIGHHKDTIHIHNGHKLKCLNVYDSLMDISKISPKDFHEVCSDIKVISFSVAITVGTTLLVALIVILFKNRWRIRFSLFRLTESCKQCHGKNDTDRVQYRFDAYVAYADDDRFWVCNSLLSELERECSLKLCIRDRDFLAGNSNIELIVRGISTSRDMIIIFGKNSLKYEWFKFELEHAIIKLNKTGKEPIVITLHNIGSIGGNSAASHILGLNQYLEWVDDKHGRKLLWKKLVRLLYGNDKDCSEICCCGKWCRKRRNGYTRLPSLTQESFNIFDM